MMVGRAIQLGVILGAVGCAASYRLPLTPTQVAQAGEPGALVRYLGQRDADPAVCDAAIAGPHVTADARAGRALLGALQSGAVEPAIWQACVDRILANAGSDAQAALLDAMLHTYRALVGHPRLERDPMAQARLAALTAVYGERSPDIRVPAAAAAALAAELRKTARTLGPIGKRSAEQMIATLDVEHGVWGTRAIDPAFLDELATPDYEPFLGFLAQRLPDPALRSEAKRRVIRLHIASSAFYEVQEDAGHVEAMMMELGKNPIAPRLQAPTAAHFDASQLAIDHVIVSQDVRAQTASLAGAPPAGTGGPTVPSFALRGALALDVTGVSQPITLCGAASELDVAPCLLPGDLAIDSPYVRLDSDGTLQLASALTAAQVVELARGRHELAVPLTIAHQSLTDLRWPIAFAIPDPFIAAGERFGAPGPALNVIVEQRDDVLIYAIDTGHAIHWAVVPVAAAAQFAIVSRGGHGAPGRQGKDGADGYAGSDGAPGVGGAPGGDGGDGEDGGDGGPGGAGGAVRVQLTCDPAACDDLIASLRTAIRSEGGAGGLPGRGGFGGHGGTGGSPGQASSDQGSTAVTGGAAGNDGRSGKDGAAGAPGASGTVRFQIERVPAAP